MSEKQTPLKDSEIAKESGFKGSVTTRHAEETTAKKKKDDTGLESDEDEDAKKKKKGIKKRANQADITEVMFRSRNMRSRVAANPRLFTEKHRYKDRPKMNVKFADIPQEKVEKVIGSDYDYSPTKSEAPSPAKDENMRIDSPKLPQIPEESPQTPFKQGSNMDLPPEQVQTPEKAKQPTELGAVKEMPADENIKTKRDSSCEERAKKDDEYIRVHSPDVRSPNESQKEAKYGHVDAEEVIQKQQEE